MKLLTLTHSLKSIGLGYGLKSSSTAYSLTKNVMDRTKVHVNITMMLHNIHTDLVATGNASRTWTPPKAKVSVNVV